MVIFEEGEHKYTTLDGTEYTSVTTVIGKYKEEFDSIFWSTYKAIERFVINTKSEKEWKSLKSELNPKGIVRSFDLNNLPEYISKNEILSIRNEILIDWEYEKDTACRNGTGFHKSREEEWLSSNKHIIEGKSFNTGNATISKDSNIPLPLEELSDGIYSELTLWNNYYGVAGQADKVIIETIGKNRYIDIDDYKTNKEISLKSYYNPKTKRNKTMLYPLTSIMDCNYYHYKLQINTYAYLLKCAGYIPRNLTFRHYSNIGTKEVPDYMFNKLYLLEYDERSVVKMLNHFKRSK